MTARKASTKVADKETEAPAEDQAPTFSAKEIAEEVDTDPKTFRRWLRSYTEDRANKGGRWIFNEESKAQVIEAYKNRGTKATPAPDAN